MNDLSNYPTPFSHPAVSVPSTDFSGILLILFFLIFLCWAVYSVVAAYHWLRYGRTSWLSIPAIVIHVVVSGLCILLIASGV